MTNIANLLSRHWILLLLTASAAMRLWLAGLGGQYFFGDEFRYQRGIDLYLAVGAGRWQDVQTVLALPEHGGFVWLGALVTAGQHALATLSGHGN